MMTQTKTDDLARVRAEFEQWRSQSSGRGRIPDRLWRMAIGLLDHTSPSVVCRELRLAAGDLKKRRQALTPALEATSVVAPAFVEVRAVDLTGPAIPSPTDIDRGEAPVHVELTRGDGARLVLEIPPRNWQCVEALYCAFLRG